MTFSCQLCLIALAEECECLHSCVSHLIHNSPKVSMNALYKSVNQVLNPVGDIRVWDIATVYCCPMRVCSIERLPLWLIIIDFPVKCQKLHYPTFCGIRFPSALIRLDNRGSPVLNFFFMSYTDRNLKHDIFYNIFELFKVFE